MSNLPVIIVIFMLILGGIAIIDAKERVHEKRLQESERKLQLNQEYGDNFKIGCEVIVDDFGKSKSTKKICYRVYPNGELVEIATYRLPHKSEAAHGIRS